MWVKLVWLYESHWLALEAIHIQESVLLVEFLRAQDEVQRDVFSNCPEIQPKRIDRSGRRVFGEIA